MNRIPIAMGCVAGAIVLIAALTTIAQQSGTSGASGTSGGTGASGASSTSGGQSNGTTTGSQANGTSDTGGTSGSSTTTQPGQTNQSGQRRGASAAGAGGGTQDIGKLDDETTGGTVRISQLMGADIKNSQNEEIGEVEDLVIDGSGQVRYAAVTYGGFLGVGSKMFAVPFEAFRVQLDPDEADDDEAGDEAGDYVLMLDVTQQQLDGAQGFDENSWPDFGDSQFEEETYRRYRIDRTNRNATGTTRGSATGSTNSPAGTGGTSGAGTSGATDNQ